MIQIRRSVFETNSSSTHTLTMCDDSTYQAWEAGEVGMYYSYSNPIFKPIEEILEDLRNDMDETEYQKLLELRESDISEFYQQLADCGWDTDGYYSDCDTLTYFHREFTTTSGEKVHAFGQFGYG